MVDHNHSLLIRKNNITDNAATGNDVNGGGMHIMGGKIICEDNEITNNSANATAWVFGGGICALFLDAEGVIKEAIMRNNLISNNRANTGSAGGGGGGGYYQGFSYEDGNIQVYNNVISNNYATFTSGGAMFWDDTRGSIFNNTIVDNKVEAPTGGNNVAFVWGVALRFYNNIVWSFEKSDKRDIRLYSTEANKLHVFNNIIVKSFGPGDGVSAFSNTYYRPYFKPNSFELEENSPGIGWGIDSLLVGSTWVYAPVTDMFDSIRPNPVDQYVDLGAMESGFPKTDTNTFAYLSSIQLWNRIPEPSFHRDTLHYEFSIPDTVTVFPQLEIIPTISGAVVVVVPSTNLHSPDPADRTTNITVTALDGVTQLEYTVTFYLRSTDATLNSLSVGQGFLEPEFDPEILYYDVLLPYGTTEVPTLSYVTSDEMAAVEVKDASDLTQASAAYRTSSVNVTAEDGVTKLTYRVVFQLSTGSKDVKNNGVMKLFPNPTTNLLTIETNQPASHSIEIISLSGQLIYRTEMEGNSKQIDLSPFTKGIYFITIRSNAWVKTEKVVKL